MRLALLIALLLVLGCGSVTMSPLLEGDASAPQEAATAAEAGGPEVAPVVEPARDGAAPEAAARSCSGVYHGTICVSESKWACLEACKSAAGVPAWPAAGESCLAEKMPDGQQVVCVARCADCVQP